MSITLGWQGPVAILTVDRPAARNALDFETMATFGELVDHLDSIARYPGSADPPRAVILTGGGTRFIAGGDLKALAAHTSIADGQALAAHMQRTLTRLAVLPLPVIAAVERDALGGGAEVLLACDLVIAGTDARLAFRQVHLGVTTAWGGTRRLIQRVGRARALDLLWTGRDIPATEALTLGLIDRLAPPGRALDAALALAAELSTHPPAVLAGFKRLADDPEVDETSLFAATWAAEPHQQAVQKWLTSRPTPGNQMEKSRGRFIVLEGIDGAGTTTQARLLTRWLQRRGRTVLQTNQPSTGPFGTLIRQALRGRLTAPAGRLDPRVIAGLFVADRADHLSTEIEPALATGKDVICDRYVLSSIAYQGSECDPAWIRALNAPFPTPDLTLFVDVSVETAAARRAKRGGIADLFEVDDFQRKVTEAYRAAAIGVPGLVTIDGARSVREVFRACQAAIDQCST